MPFYVITFTENFKSKIMETILNFFIQCLEFIKGNWALCVLIAWSFFLAIAVSVLWTKNYGLKWRKECLEDYIDQVEEEDIPGFAQRIEILKEDLKIAKNQRDCAQGKLSALDKRAFCIEQAIMITNPDLSFKEAFKQVSACLNGKS